MMKPLIVAREAVREIVAEVVAEEQVQPCLLLRLCNSLLRTGLRLDCYVYRKENEIER